MITALIVCVTVIICLIIILLWAKDMSSANLPMFTYGECVWKEEADTTPTTQSIGFQPEVETPKDKTDKEQKEAYLKDPITLTASLLRGEVDIDDITN